MASDYGCSVARSDVVSAKCSFLPGITPSGEISAKRCKAGSYNVKRALAVCAFCLLPVGSAWAQAWRCNDFGGLKTSAEQKAIAVREALERKADRNEVCALVTRFAAAEEAVVEFLLAIKTQCGVPDVAVTTARANHERTLKFQKAACTELPGAQPTPRERVATPPPNGHHNSSASISVAMKMEGGIYVVPVLINDAITLNFVVDSGAAHVSIPADVVMTLMRTETIKNTTFSGNKHMCLRTARPFLRRRFASSP